VRLGGAEYVKTVRQKVIEIKWLGAPVLGHG